MKQLVKLLGIGLGTGMVAVALSFFPWQRAAAVVSTSVLVTNGSGQAVPVAYPTTPTVNAAQSGPWNVGLAGAPSVTVANSPSVTVSGTPSVNVANTVSVSEGGQPVMASLCGALGTSCPTPTSYSVPNGEILIVEYASGTCLLSAGLDGSAMVNGVALLNRFGGTDFGPGVVPFMQAQTVGTGQGITGTSLFSFAQQTKIYADPLSNVSAAVIGEANNGGSASCNLTISGRLVPGPLVNPINCGNGICTIAQ
jgi:hypothetical protein